MFLYSFNPTSYLEKKNDCSGVIREGRNKWQIINTVERGEVWGEGKTKFLIFTITTELAVSPWLYTGIT